jgi:hypothetical protein
MNKNSRKWQKSDTKDTGIRAAFFWLKACQRVLAAGGKPEKLADNDGLIREEINLHASLYDIEGMPSGLAKHVMEQALKAADDEMRCFPTRYADVIKHFSV